MNDKTHETIMRFIIDWLQRLKDSVGGCDEEYIVDNLKDLIELIK